MPHCWRLRAGFVLVTCFLAGVPTAPVWAAVKPAVKPATAAVAPASGSGTTAREPVAPASGSGTTAREPVAEPEVKPVVKPVVKPAPAANLSGAPTVDLAVAQLEAGRLEEAKKTWTQIMATKPEDIRTRFRYAEFLERAGDPGKAIETMRQVAEQNLIVAAPRYWIAEAYVRQGKTHEAAEELQQMLKDFPREQSEITRRMQAIAAQHAPKAESR